MSEEQKQQAEKAASGISEADHGVHSLGDVADTL